MGGDSVILVGGLRVGGLRVGGFITFLAGLVLESRTASYGQVLETPVHAMVVGAAVLPFEKGTTRLVFVVGAALKHVVASRARGKRRNIGVHDCEAETHGCAVLGGWEWLRERGGPQR